MKAIAVDQTNLCDDCGCAGFVPALTFAINTTTKVATITNASTYDSGDALAKVVVHVYDKNGLELHGVITGPSGTNVAINIATLDLTNLTIKATVVTTGGCKADLGAYNLGAQALTGSMGYVADQGDIS